MTATVTNTFTNGSVADATQVNQNFTDVLGELNATTKNGTMWTLFPPVGAVMAWLKTYTNTPALPAGWVECNGQTLSDAGSVYNGQVIPNLNASSGGTHRFLRGSTTSGTTGGGETHTHGITDVQGSGGNQTLISRQITPANTDSESSLPSYYEVVWIIRIK